MTIPYFYIKTTRALFLDDKVTFLKSLEALFSDDISMEVLTDQNSFLSKVNKISDIRKKLLRTVDSDSESHKAIKIDLKELTKTIFLLAESKPVSVVFVDYNMPNKNGLEVCKGITNPYVKKVLFTGEVSEIEGVDVFNRGLINAYINKASKNISHDVIEIFHRLNDEYIKNIQEWMIDLFGHDLNFLYKDPVFCKEYEICMNRDNVLASCWYDQLGSQIIRNKDHDLLLNVYLQKEIDDVLLPALDDGYYPEYRKKLEKGHILDYKRDGILEIPPIEKWGDYLSDDYIKCDLAGFFIKKSIKKQNQD